MNGEILLLRKLAVRLLRSWPVLLVAVVVWSLVALLASSISPAFYQSKVSLLVQEPYRMDDPQRWILGEQRFNEPGRAYIVNEGIRMKELSLMHQTCDSLQLGLRYLEKGLLVDQEIYQKAPFDVQIDTLSKEAHIPTGIAFLVQPLPNGAFHIEGEGAYGPEETEIEIDQDLPPGESLVLGAVQISITPRKDRLFDPEKDYLFELVNTQELALELVDAVEIDAVQLESSIFTASIMTSPQGKGKDILQVLSTFYVRKKLHERRQVLRNTLGTIKTEITEIRKQLVLYESDIEQYKSQTEINSTEEEGKSLLERIASLEMLRTDLQTRQEYLAYLNNSLSKASGNTNLVMPSAYGLSDQSLNQLVTDFNGLVLKKGFYENEDKTSHPAYALLASEVAAKAGSIGAAVEGFASSNALRLSRLNTQIAEAKKQSAELPFQQMELLRKDRSFNALDANYRALNQRSVEAGIALASLSADVKVIERAHDSSVDPIFPDPVLLAIFIVLLSVASPFLYLLAKTILGKSPIEPSEASTLTQGRSTVYSLRAGGLLSLNELKTNTPNGHAQDLRKLGHSLVQTLSEGPQLVAITPAGKHPLLAQDMDMLLSQMDLLGVPTLCLDFKKTTQARSYRATLEALKNDSLENITQPLNNETDSVVLKLCIDWQATDVVKPTDRLQLSSFFDQFELIVLTLPTEEDLPAAATLQSLADIHITFLPYGSTFPLPLAPSGASMQKEMLVLSNLPPHPFQWKEWISLLQTKTLGIMGVTKMLFNRI